MIYEEPKVDVIEFAEGESIMTLNESETGSGGTIMYNSPEGRSTWFD